MMSYKGYQAAITFDHDAEVFHGEVVGTRDVIFFEATTVDELKSANNLRGSVIYAGQLLHLPSGS